jgi:hypothetical protein
MLVSFLAYSSTLKMVVTCSSETSADFQQTAQLYIPEDRTIHFKVILEVNKDTVLEVDIESSAYVMLPGSGTQSYIRTVNKSCKCS